MEWVATRRRARVLVAVLLALVAALAWSLAAYRMSAGQSSVERVDSMLLTSNRSSLEICADSQVQEVSDEDLRRAIADGLSRVQSHPHYEAAGLAEAPARVDASCPGPARLLMPGFDPVSGSADGSPTAVETPSRYRVFVFVVPREKALQQNGTLLRRAVQESLCGHGACAEVTTALYLTPEDLEASTGTDPSLTRAVGLDPDPATEDPFE